MYTEDGSWTGFIYRVGPLHTYQVARPDYLVIGNIALLHLATIINDSIFQDTTIDHLPVVIAGISLFFFAGVAALPVVTLRAYLPLWTRLVIWAFLLCLPMGTHLNEMIGRLSNVGFSFAFIAVMLSLWRMSLPLSHFSWQRLAIDAGLVLCCATNPVALGVVALLFCAELYRRRLTGVVNDALLLVGWLVIAYVVYKGRATPLVVHDATHSIGGLIASGAARPLLYPFIFPFYKLLNSALAVSVAAAYLAFLAVGWWLSRQKLALGFLIACLLMITAAVALSRPEIQQTLIDYRLTFPDRYFHAQNMLALVCFVWIAAELTSRTETLYRIGAPTALGFVALLYALFPWKVFEIRSPAYVIRTGPSFGEQLRAGVPNPNMPGFMNVEIYPPQWAVEYPVRFKQPRP
jgi:hypothetical protein